MKDKSKKLFYPLYIEIVSIIFLIAIGVFVTLCFYSFRHYCIQEIFMCSEIVSDTENQKIEFNSENKELKILIKNETDQLNYVELKKEEAKTFRFLLLFGIVSLTFVFIVLIVCLTKIYLKADVGFRQKKFDLLSDEEKLKKLVSCLNGDSKETQTITKSIDEPLKSQNSSKRKTIEKTSSSELAEKYIGLIMDV